VTTSAACDTAILLDPLPLEEVTPAMSPRRLLSALALCASAAAEEASCSSAEEACAGVVLVDYEALASDADPAALEALVSRAFTAGGLGILGVRGVPPEFLRARRTLLELGRQLAGLSESALSEFESPEHSYIVGWSRGRERFKGEVDKAKASFYANGLYDDPSGGDAELRRRYPGATAVPVWPDAALRGNFSGAFRDLSQRLYDLSLPVLRHCDAVVKRALEARGLSAGASLAAVTHERSRLHVGRLLHYYPREAAAGGDAESGWCGWHNDNSVITALVPAMYFHDATGREVPALDACARAGLIAFVRDGEAVRVDVPEDVVLFQIGEAAQILSGGVLVATPHAVAAPSSDSACEQAKTLSRESFAIFIEPHWTEPLLPPAGVSLAAVVGAQGDVAPIPPLAKRLPAVPVEFAKFLGDSVLEYY